ncbi:site-2 protease family protein [Nocardioides sp. TF02-7]|uniref:site-2 protease family protein n=1 Tax=Nocardioides sp. TF02-7 TaxID=2917724 RepID=UPI0023DC54D3|nr:site-2 protease family protein [Nocardioides sp. TF02-7]
MTPRFLDAEAEEPEPVGFLGVRPESSPTTGGPLYTLEQMGVMTVDVVEALATLPAKVFDVAQAIVGLEERDPTGPVSIVGGGRLAGETAAHEEILVDQKVMSLLMLIAGFNFFIGMFNFVPLLPLDGGHIASAVWEALRRRFARLRGRPDPGYVDAAKLLPVAYVVASAMLVMGVVLIVGDLVVPVRLTS